MTGTPCGADATTEKKAPAFSAPEDTLKYCPCIKNNTCDTARPTPPPATAAVGYKQPPPHHHHHGGGCQYDTLAGELWDMRLKQLIVANGVAIVQVNPASDDGWVAYGTSARALSCPARAGWSHSAPVEAGARGTPPFALLCRVLPAPPSCALPPHLFCWTGCGGAGHGFAPTT